ncbi:MAG: holin [Bacteriophage sp.]|nr:MAG: holin [Bacteriophage sp.]UVM91532.1 MAG: holin [Bacteriophage sp.]UVN01828.1 MAG: holin [Bacteriophage sp.]UVX34558.1 MAG: holin [Bacteriophage sp.]UVX36019.1 MAG: holin [Bacteriophage sp.]
MKKINWKVRFSKDNLTFILRFIGALAVPILAYFGLKFEDITSFDALLDVLVRAVSNPYVLGLTVINALNMIPDPTTKGITDSENALNYTEPKR